MMDASVHVMAIKCALFCAYLALSYLALSVITEKIQPITIGSQLQMGLTASLHLIEGDVLQQMDKIQSELRLDRNICTQ